MFFFCNDTATTEIYTLSLHDALPIWRLGRHNRAGPRQPRDLRGRVARARVVKLVVREVGAGPLAAPAERVRRSEEHTSELQSRQYLVCRLLLEKKKKNTHTTRHYSQD